MGARNQSLRPSSRAHRGGKPDVDADRAQARGDARDVRERRAANSGGHSVTEVTLLAARIVDISSRSPQSVAFVPAMRRLRLSCCVMGENNYRMIAIDL